MSKLTEVAIKKAKPEANPYKMADGGGLYLVFNCIITCAFLNKYP